MHYRAVKCLPNKETCVKLIGVISVCELAAYLLICSADIGEYKELWRSSAQMKTRTLLLLLRDAAGDQSSKAINFREDAVTTVFDSL